MSHALALTWANYGWSKLIGRSYVAGRPAQARVWMCLIWDQGPEREMPVIVDEYVSVNLWLPSLEHRHEPSLCWAMRNEKSVYVATAISSSTSGICHWPIIAPNDQLAAGSIRNVVIDHVTADWPMIDSRSALHIWCSLFDGSRLRDWLMILVALTIGFKRCYPVLIIDLRGRRWRTIYWILVLLVGVCLSSAILMSVSTDCRQMKLRLI